MLIQSLEQKTRLALMTVVMAVTGCVIICGFTVYYCSKLVEEERSQIYVIDGDIPFLAERSKQEANFVMEAKAHIQLFHQYFFNLPPDDDYIKWTLGKAMYMADGTAMKQKQAMEENGFYSDVISSSAVCTIICDSIQLNEHEGHETFHRNRRGARERSTDTEQSSWPAHSQLEDFGKQGLGLLITWEYSERKRMRGNRDMLGCSESSSGACSRRHGAGNVLNGRTTGRN